MNTMYHVCQTLLNSNWESLHMELALSKFSRFDAYNWLVTKVLIESK